MRGACVLPAALVAALLPAVFGPAVGETYPARPITLVVPFAPGGSASTMARSVADKMSEQIGKETATPIPYGSPGTGTLNHLTVELLAYRTGMKLSHVPYKGAAPALNDLLGGHIGVLISAIPNAHSHLVAGTIHGLAVTGAKRSALIPAVPTFAEAGLAGYDVPLRWGLAAPAGTPRAVIDTLNRALNAALMSDEVRQRLLVEGAEPQPSTPEAYAAIIHRELTMW